MVGEHQASRCHAAWEPRRVTVYFPFYLKLTVPLPAHQFQALILSFALRLGAVLHISRDGPPHICGGFLSRQTEEYFLPRMIQDLTKQVSESWRRKPVLGQTSLWGGPWGQDPSGQSNGHHHGPCKEHKQRGDVCNKWGGSREHGGGGDGGRLLSPV